MAASQEIIQKIVETIIAESSVTADENGIKKHKDKSGVMVIKTKSIKVEPWEQPGIYLKQATSLEEAPRMGCGVMELDGTGSLEWTLTYDEYDYIIDGILQIEIDGKSVIGCAGDIILIPRDSHVIFKTPCSTRFAYFVYPAATVDEIV
ncbi:MAG: ethanolamine utilization protein EutQ [Aminipila sp.]